MDGVFLAQSGRFSQRDKSFGERSNTQCTAIAAFSIPALSSWRPPYSRDHLDLLVRGGEEYNVQCKEFVKDHVYLAPDELQPEIIIGSLRVRIEVLQCGEGSCTPTTELDLRTLVSTFRDVFSFRYPALGFIFMGHSKSVSFLPASSNSHQLWFFNPHSVNSNNDVCISGRNGCCRLFTPTLLMVW